MTTHLIRILDTLKKAGIPKKMTFPDKPSFLGALGSVMISWFVDNKLASSRPAAQALGQQMIGAPFSSNLLACMSHPCCQRTDAKIIKHIDSRPVFDDSQAVYMLVVR
jgi:hypothetical protein